VATDARPTAIEHRWPAWAGVSSLEPEESLLRSKKAAGEAEERSSQPFGLGCSRPLAVSQNRDRRCGCDCASTYLRQRCCRGRHQHACQVASRGDHDHPLQSSEGSQDKDNSCTECACNRPKADAVVEWLPSGTTERGGSVQRTRSPSLDERLLAVAAAEHQQGNCYAGLGQRRSPERGHQAWLSLGWLEQ
jgi:hypothetical protein